MYVCTLMYMHVVRASAYAKVHCDLKRQHQCQKNASKVNEQLEHIHVTCTCIYMLYLHVQTRMVFSYHCRKQPLHHAPYLIWVAVTTQQMNRWEYMVETLVFKTQYAAQKCS